MTLHPFLVYIGKTAVEVERDGDKNYSRRYGHDNFVTSKIQFTVGYDYYICHFLPNWFFQFNKWEIVRYNSNTLGDRHSFLLHHLCCARY